jgi:hypothetical protein
LEEKLQRKEKISKTQNQLLHGGAHTTKLRFFSRGLGQLRNQLSSTK